MVPAPLLGGSYTEQDPPSEADSATCLVSPSPRSAAAAAVLLHHTWLSRFSTCGSHGIAAAAL